MKFYRMNTQQLRAWLFYNFAHVSIHTSATRTVEIYIEISSIIDLNTYSSLNHISILKMDLRVIVKNSSILTTLHSTVNHFHAVVLFCIIMQIDDEKVPSDLSTVIHFLFFFCLYPLFSKYWDLIVVIEDLRVPWNWWFGFDRYLLIRMIWDVSEMTIHIIPKDTDERIAYEPRYERLLYQSMIWKHRITFSNTRNTIYTVDEKTYFE